MYISKRNTWASALVPPLPPEATGEGRLLSRDTISLSQVRREPAKLPPKHGAAGAAQRNAARQAAPEKRSPVSAAPGRPHLHTTPVAPSQPAPEAQRAGHACTACMLSTPRLAGRLGVAAVWSMTGLARGTEQGNERGTEQRASRGRGLAAGSVRAAAEQQECASEQDKAGAVRMCVLCMLRCAHLHDGDHGVGLITQDPHHLHALHSRPGAARQGRGREGGGKGTGNKSVIDVSSTPASPARSSCRFSSPAQPSWVSRGSAMALSAGPLLCATWLGPLRRSTAHHCTAALHSRP